MNSEHKKSKTKQRATAFIFGGYSSGKKECRREKLRAVGVYYFALFTTLASRLKILGFVQAPGVQTFIPPFLAKVLCAHGKTRKRTQILVKFLNMHPAIRAIVLAVLSASVLRACALDISALKPPAGAKAAIIVFEDLEGPECANASSLVQEAADAHKIPVLRYDFPLPRHSWSFSAAVWARYFDGQDTKNVKTGNEFRRYIYANQKQISRDNLQQWVQKFADQHSISLPAANDPEGKLAQKVKADFALGQRIGVEHPPTIWVISNGGASQPAVEEITNNQLNQMIDDVLKRATAVARNPAPKKSALNHQQKRLNQGVNP